MSHSTHAKHAHCAHTHMSYCAPCQIVFCHDCDQEWLPKPAWTFSYTQPGTNAPVYPNSGTAQYPPGTVLCGHTSKG